MPQDPAVALSALLRNATIDDHDEILQAANAAIKGDKNNQLARHTKIVALLKLDRFDDAIRAIAEGGSKLESQCLLEKAYALYKLGKLNEAATDLNSRGLDSRALQHVAAQVAYRDERFKDAETLYKQLEDGDPAHEANDLHINVTAAQAQSLWQNSSSSPAMLSGNPPELFELCYNSACAYIARGSFQAAADLLQRAAQLCDASDDLTEEDKLAELKPILAQQAYVSARLGDAQKAQDLYRSLDSSRDADPDLHVLAQNNALALDQAASNPFLLQRQTAAWLSDTTKVKLFNYQSSLLMRNASLIDLRAHKVDGVRDRTRRTLGQVQHPSIDGYINAVSVVNAAAETNGLGSAETLRKAVALHKKRPNHLGLMLVVLQLHLQRKNMAAALSVLESFLQSCGDSAKGGDRDVRFSPGLVALTVSLMRALRRESAAKAELVKAANYWRNRPLGSCSSLLKEAGVELAKSSSQADLSLAASAFKRLEESQGTAIVSAGLVASLAASDVSKVEQHVAQLPSIESLIDGIDVDAIARAGVATLSSSPSVATKRAAADGPTGERASKRARKRTRLPKNLVEGKAPDPERWLPLRDRSTYRPKGKKGKRRVAESTQGGIVKDEETLELVGGGGVKVEKTSAPGSSSNKKKKKKGKK
ncbi:hypothetical protein HIM_04825 [Hirsutella minnesotensis 3608]|uniref:Signal recognition particle subunit SRP72 n=1 Tax=Hirsutella minnesotensis 3608 TaxID=1043627 RepID=A0A0F7ZUY4_9HYPO|nr:hypothetical protein HIM_04825 [Hirsutella minnesotensis 3608]